MDDPIASLREATTKAEAKASRLRGQLATAEKELEELNTAMRVMERFSGYGAAAIAATTQVSDNGALILRYIEDGERNGKAPKDVFEQITADGHDLNADLIRTQLWRMAKRGALETREGRYWRPVSDHFPHTKLPSDDRASEGNVSSGPVGRESGYPPSAPEGSNPSGSTLDDANPFRAGWDQIDDDDVPF